MSHQLRYAANCSLLFTELPLLERPHAAREAGFDAIELWWPFAVSVPSDRDVDALVRAVQDAGVQLVGLNFAAGDMPVGDRGLLSWPARSAEFADNVDVAVGIGERLGTMLFNALYGNRIDGLDPQRQDDVATQSLARAAQAAAKIGGTVLVEPISGAQRYPLLTAADAVAVIDRVQRASGCTNLALLADLFHLTTNGDDVRAAIDSHGRRIGHVQVADVPGRGEPGSGSLDIDGHLLAIEAAGYRGWVALEYRPSTTTTQSLAWLPRQRRSAVTTTSTTGAPA